MNELDQFKQTYFQECEELLVDLEENLLALQADGGDSEALHAAFRATHSIKGGAGAFGFNRLVAFAHTFETILDLMRDHSLEASPDNVGLALQAADVLADLARAARTGEDLVAGHETAVAAALNALGGLEPVDPGAADDDDDDFDDLFAPVPVAEAAPPPAAASAEAGASGPVTYTISLVPHPDMLRRGTEPLLLLRELKALGAVTARANVDALPPLEALEPDDAHIAWTIDVITEAGRAAVEEVFDFAGDDCDLTITTDADDEAAATPPPPPVDEDEPEPQPQPQPQPAPVVVAAEPAKADPAPKPAVKPEPKAGEAKAPESKAADPKPADGKPAAVSSMRVDTSKLDRMVNMVGELVITQAMLMQQSQGTEADELHRGLSELQQHTRDLQEGVMAMRAQPVKTVFSRIPRLVRELAAQTGKRIRLETTGETTEIDTTVVEQLGDPLTHMIRNAADHGLETPEEREAVGKPPEGVIHLSAGHRGGRILIQIRDDGRGINRERVLKKAIEKGLVAPDASLTDEEIDNLVFLPGFSTAEAVSNLSGRGVGMDVVMRNIQNMGGRVSIQSKPGQGACISLSLPLTLAVLDGMIVRVGGQSFVVPLTNIVESLRPLARDLHPVAGSNDRSVLAIRGEYIPVEHLSRLLNIPGAVEDAAQALVLIAETEGGGKVGLVVDEILGQQQVVIKSLEENFGRVEGIAAATILGSGQVALIVDIMGLKALGGAQQAAARADSPGRALAFG
ncbi:chemotaxis protein CheA [Novispirillum sp. DQ9]|uniref:chemotaxis protein CheA n=1 Tax=Novispirillum sp. DQ9 TaxID=3398612 RepID=UPI003C7EB84C